MSVKNTTMWSAIHHDNRNDLVFIWHTDGTRDTFKSKHVFYTPNNGEYAGLPCGMTDIYGNDVYEVITDSKTELDLKTKHKGKYNHLHECDIDYRTRWLQKYYSEMDEIRFNVPDINICYLDIEVASKKGIFPTATAALFPVNCVTLGFSKTNDYVTYGLNRDISPETAKKLAEFNCTYIRCSSESELLSMLFKKIGDSNVDVLTGYNTSFFDFPYLVNRANRLDIDLKLMSRLPGNYKSVYVSKRDNELKIGGTEVIDYLKLHKKFSRSETDNNKLDTVGYAITGERKAPLPDGYMSYINYWDDFVWYNFKDVELLKQIETKQRLFETTFGACSEARVPFSGIFEAKKMLVGFMMNYLHKRNMVMPPLRENERKWFPGAYVYAIPGLYEDEVSYDYRSMYPSIMMGANISPETKVVFGYDEYIPPEVLKTLVRSPWTSNGKYRVFYRRDKVGVIPDVVNILFNGRTLLKKKKLLAEKAGNMTDASYFNMKQDTYKLFGNSLYGLLGNPYFQFYDIDNSASVTAFGRELITTTIHDLNKYFEGDFKVDARYKKAFGKFPTIETEFTGVKNIEVSFNDKVFGLSELEDNVDIYDDIKDSFDEEEIQENMMEEVILMGEHVPMYNRLSHGDTDSFFVKFTDIYKDYKVNTPNGVEIVVISDKNITLRKNFDISTEEGLKESKKYFNKMCNEFTPSWSTISDKEKKDNFLNGIYIEKDNRVLYSKYRLTDYCRILDAVLLEDKLAEFMSTFAEKWNFKDNTLFLKREKCIPQVIVTARKKYICYVESNEDIVIRNKKTGIEAPEFKVTGLDIVRSSTPPFTRKRMQGLISDILKTKDKEKIKTRYMEIKREFFELIEKNDIYDISLPSGVKRQPPSYEDYYENWDAEMRKKVDWRVRSGIVWNHLLETNENLKNAMLEPIFEGSKVKFIKVVENRYGITSMAYVGDKCPIELLELFTPDWEKQWKTAFSQTIERLFDAIGWGKDFESDTRDSMCELL